MPSGRLALFLRTQLIVIVTLIHCWQHLLRVTAFPTRARCFCIHSTLLLTLSLQDTCPPPVTVSPTNTGVHLYPSGYPYRLPHQYLSPAFNISMYKTLHKILSPSKNLQDEQERLTVSLNRSLCAETCTTYRAKKGEFHVSCSISLMDVHTCPNLEVTSIFSSDQPHKAKEISLSQLWE